MPIPLTVPFVPGSKAPADRSARVHVFVAGSEGIAVVEDASGTHLPDVPVPEDAHYLGRLENTDCFALPLDANAPPAGTVVKSLRHLYGKLPDALFAVAGRAVQVIDWDRTHRFCGRCGSTTQLVAGERARKCPACGLSSYPRISPAVIVLVRKGRQALLARSGRFPVAFFSTLAGFVEVGETLEETVAREIREEVGIEVTNARYFGSQPWPFPHSLMLGFTADWAAGEIHVDGEEIAEAHWYDPENTPRIPPRLSIARQLIDAWSLETTGHPAKDA